MHMLSVAVSPETELVLVSRLDRESCDVKTHSRVGICPQTAVCNVNHCPTLKAYERGHECLGKRILDVCEHRNKVRCGVLQFCSESCTSTDIESVAEFFSFTMITRVSDSFLLTLIVSAAFCAESAAPENARAQMIVIILFIPSLILRLQRYGKKI